MCVCTVDVFYQSVYVRTLYSAISRCEEGVKERSAVGTLTNSRVRVRGENDLRENGGGVCMWRAELISFSQLRCSVVTLYEYSVVEYAG